MITIQKNVFKLDTAHTSYLFRVTPQGHLEHVYYGPWLPQADANVLARKHTISLGSTVDYTPAAPGYCLDNYLLEYSGIGKGDFRHSPLECILPDGSFVTDFIYDGYTQIQQPFSADCGLPFAAGNGQTLSIRLKDKKYPSLVLTLHYTLFPECDVIGRNAELCNGTDGEVSLRRFLSAMVDIPFESHSLLTLDGTWAKEAHIHTAPVTPGIHIQDSTVGASSNRHNPAFALLAEGADERQGQVLGFNLLYSGNHYSAVELDSREHVRIGWGISPHCFQWDLAPGQQFVTLQAVMTFSENGINGMAANFHDFVNAHIIPAPFRGAERPVVLNNWEATMFHFDRKKILTMARQAAQLGIEMFVLDDGWFGSRNSDKAGLGDWVVNEKKLPGGIPRLCSDINRMGLKFGLWFEPECVNPDSQLYRAHPDWAIHVPGRQASLGRNQLVLDLTRPEVRDYVVNAVDSILCSANIEYVKWDYNRHISDMFSPAISRMWMEAGQLRTKASQNSLASSVSKSPTLAAGSSTAQPR